ncbi:Uncharacterised protein [Legionella steigerwaltii]|uniref:Uncharacterized protein n=1 Tax=Legionella steigerwaltii TaxID=460 RepID=A0A378L960_9GAMM|nr:hypothetical protein [Legionella steigerwaltii]KTD77023.1 hypothetical protein Lstg_2266 [Legionella steigerwaltii]STY22452.1 Uncharacterised protein [Legionella steigerwaltii]
MAYSRANVIRNDKNLVKLHNLIKEKLQLYTPTRENSVQVKKEPLSREKAARIIQKTWRMSRIAEQFSKHGHESYLNMLQHGDDEINFLAELMFGRTVAAVLTRFPNNPYLPRRAKYHRDDDLSGSYFDKVISLYDTYKSHSHEYIPIISTKSTPIETILETNLINHSEFIEVIKYKDEKIQLVKIKSSHPDAEKAVKILQRSGMIASPWEISILMSKHKLVETSNFNLSSNQPDISNPVKIYLPTTLKELKESELMVKLAKIKSDKGTPNHLLAKCLYKMIINLPETNNEEIIKRIYIFLNIAVDFYKNNYNKFAICLYKIIHEISLLLYENNRDKKAIGIEYNQFREHRIDKSLSSFGLKKSDMINSHCVASPAMAGTNAFTLALQLAKKMKHNKEPISIEMIGPYYYEFVSLYPYVENKADHLADIYVISSGPITYPTGILPGVDINKLIRNRIIKHKDFPAKPVVIVVDTTSGLEEDLKLDEDLKKYIYNGDISIIVNESHQKFGLLHSDQVQYGEVFGICSKKLFLDSTLKDFETNARDDFQSHLDMIVGAYIDVTAGDDLELVKKQHFEAGAIYGDLLKRLNLTKPHVYQYKEMIKDTNKLYFTYIKKTDKAFKAFQDTFEYRDSFGHFRTTLSGIEDIDRVSPNASDSVDTLIDISCIYLQASTQPEELRRHLTQWVSELVKYNRPFLPEEEIIFIGMLMSLKSVQSTVTLSDQFIYLLSLKLLDRNGLEQFSHRNEPQELRSYYNKIENPTQKQLCIVLDRIFSNQFLLKGLFRIAENNLLNLDILASINDENNFKQLQNLTQFLGEHAVIILLLDKNGTSSNFAAISKYINSLSPSEKMSLYNHIQKNIDALQSSGMSQQVINEIQRTTDLSLLKDFKQIYKSQCWFTFFEYTPRSEFGGKVFGDKLQSIEEVKAYAISNPNGAVAKALKIMSPSNKDDTNTQHHHTKI